MKMAKKAFSVVLALVMLVNVFAAMGSAAAPDSAIDLYLSTDKAVYAAGEEITITVSAQAIEAVGDLRIGSGCAIAFDSTGISQYSTDVTSLASHGFTAIQDGYDSTISSLADTSMTTVTNANNWDSVMILAVADDGATSFSATSKTDLYTFKMKVADTAPDGDYVIGFNQASYEDYNAYQNDSAMGGVYGMYDDYGYGTTANYGFNNVTIKVGAPAPAYELAITPLKNQIRYNKNGDGSFKEINVRARASIDAAELQELLGVTANDDIEAAIVDVGFVFGADVDAATAKTVVNGTTVANYTKKSVEYIQNTGSAYVYTCLVDGITDDKIVAASDFECIAYIVLNIGGTNYDFYFTNDEVVAVSPLGMYNATYERANTTYGWDLAAK